jgi:hypothetical protein
MFGRQKRGVRLAENEKKGVRMTKRKAGHGRERGFTVYGFMVEELGLCGNPLLVYALLYSFSVSGFEFYGTKEYISQRIGCSLSTAKKTISDLLKSKLITKVYKNDFKTPFYVICEAECENKNESDRGGGYTADFEPVRGRNPTSEGANFAPKNKEIINTTSSTSSKSACAQRGNSSISFLKYGVEGLVTMTEAQHDSLCSSLGDDVAEAYIGRLETYLISNPGICLKSHYRTLLKWAEEDAEL